MEKLDTRCTWCHGDPLYQRYHDLEWGVPLKDEQALFEFLTLETFQAGLSWITVLRKRENFRARFHGFDIKKVACMTAAEIEEAMADAGIIRNRAKILAAINNAKLVVEMHERGQSLSDFFWSYVHHNPIQNQWKAMNEVPASTPLAEQISKDLKKLGFKFMGPTVIYAHMQATGMVNDHLITCPRHGDLS
ncbi:MAG: hypothetical protein RL754_433 [Bacteroidota bacterium]|jgi:DNA-3-methyladenine glycosylase I